LKRSKTSPVRSELENGPVDGRLFFFKVPIDRHPINAGSSDL